MSNRRIDVVWGLNGMWHAPAPTVVIVDVLSFSTAVDAACSVGAMVYPFKWRDNRVQRFAKSVGAQVAVQRQDAAAGELSLSPPSLTAMTPADRLVLPSPNGSSLATESVAVLTIAGCLRNASAVADAVSQAHGDVVIVAAGERWPDGSLRPALEDFIGAGAIVSQLDGALTQEARAAQAVFEINADQLTQALRATESGQYLYRLGFDADVEFACQHAVSAAVPVLRANAFVSDSVAGHPRDNRLS